MISCSRLILYEKYSWGSYMSDMKMHCLIHGCKANWLATLTSIIWDEIDDDDEHLVINDDDNLAIELTSIWPIDIGLQSLRLICSIFYSPFTTKKKNYIFFPHQFWRYLKGNIC